MSCMMLFYRDCRENSQENARKRMSVWGIRRNMGTTEKR